MKNRSNLGVYFRKHRIAFASIVILLGLWVVAGLLVSTNMNAAIELDKKASQQKIDAIDKQISKIEQKKVDEQKAKEAAEAEAAKKQAEEEAARQPATTPSNGTTAACNVSNTHNVPSSIDVLVNKKHCLQPLSFVPPDLVTTHGATLSAKAASDFDRMFTDAAAAGQPFTVSSSYRSYSNQVSTYNYWVSLNGQQAADTVSARPGFSEHQTGFTIDVGADGCNLNCFGSTSQYQWFQANAAGYGFIQRYYAGYEAITGYASEEWHYRYVGTTVAKDMKARGVYTLEQYWGIEGGDYRS